MQDPESIMQHPITDELDLHTFRPSDLSALLPEYFSECQRRRIHRVRIIHGKGTGTLRETVHHLLRQIPKVADFTLADASSGGWGATWVTLVPET